MNTRTSTEEPGKKVPSSNRASRGVAYHHAFLFCSAIFLNSWALRQPKTCSNQGLVSWDEGHETNSLGNCQRLVSLLFSVLLSMLIMRKDPLEQPETASPVTFEAELFSISVYKSFTTNVHDLSHDLYCRSRPLPLACLAYFCAVLQEAIKANIPLHSARAYRYSDQEVLYPADHPRPSYRQHHICPSGSGSRSCPVRNDDVASEAWQKSTYISSATSINHRQA